MDPPHAEMVLVDELVRRLKTLLENHIAQSQHDKQALETKSPERHKELFTQEYDMPDFISGGLFRVLGRLESYDPKKALAILAPVSDPTTKPVEPSPDRAVIIDLTNDDDVDDDESRDHSSHKDLAPRLLIDTRLLGGEWKMLLKSTYEFMGEARFEADQQPHGFLPLRQQWRLQARVVRNMDGVDLFTYIHSVRLMKQCIGQQS